LELRPKVETALEIRETARGLIIRRPAVPFDLGKYTLRQGARETPAKISGILPSRSDLKIKVDGYTHDIGNGRFNQTPSDERAENIRHVPD